MPGTHKTIYFVAFNLDDKDQSVRAFEPRVVVDETVAITEARSLAVHYAGVLVWKREGNPAIGEEGEPVIIFSTGRVGDFN